MTTYHRFYEQSVLSLIGGADGNYDNDLNAHVSVEIHGNSAVVELTPIEDGETLIGTERFRVFEWTASHSLAYAQGETRGAMSTAMFLLMELGEVEYDEAAETTWDLVMRDNETARALGLGEGADDA